MHGHSFDPTSQDSNRGLHDVRAKSLSLCYDDKWSIHTLNTLYDYSISLNETLPDALIHTIQKQFTSNGLLLNVTSKAFKDATANKK